MGTSKPPQEVELAQSLVAIVGEGAPNAAKEFVADRRLAGDEQGARLWLRVAELLASRQAT